MVYQPVKYVLFCIVLLSVLPTVTGQAADPYEANIEGVDYESENRNFTFWVTIYDENDETGESYPVWWQVETSDGTVLGQHQLVDPEQPRDQSENTFYIPEDVRYLTVRGYDNTYGYGGATVTIDLVGQDFQQEENVDDDEGGAIPTDGGSQQDTDDPDANSTTPVETGEDDNDTNTAPDTGEEPGQNEDNDDRGVFQQIQDSFNWLMDIGDDEDNPYRFAIAVVLASIILVTFFAITYQKRSRLRKKD